MQEQTKLLWLLNAISSHPIQHVLDAEIKASWLAEISATLRNLEKRESEAKGTDG
jgi:hypothetical protein